MKKTTTRKSANSQRSRTTAKKRGTRTRVATHHGALDLENGLGRMKTARAIAKSFKKAADASENLTTAPFHAAIAALDHLIAFLDRQKERLEAAKIELRKLYGETVEDQPGRHRAGGTAREHRRSAAKSGSGRRSRKRGEMLTSSNLARSGHILLPT